MKLYELIKRALERGNEFEGTFETNCLRGELNKAEKPFSLTLFDKKIRLVEFKVPPRLDMGKEPDSPFRKVLVMAGLAENHLLLRWVPAGQMLECGFDIFITFKTENSGSFVLMMRAPETFKDWEQQLHTLRPQTITEF